MSEEISPGRAPEGYCLECDADSGEEHRPGCPFELTPIVICTLCHGTGWTAATEIYQDGSYATGRRCPRGCQEPSSEDASQ